MHTLEQMQAADPSAKYTVRPDRRNDVDKANGIAQDGFSVGVSAGLSAQRVRGKRLADVTDQLHKVGQSNLHDPLEAVSFQINQLSQRMAMRNHLDTTKTRWLETYGRDLDLPTDRTGKAQFPTSIDSFKAKLTGSFSTEEM